MLRVLKAEISAFACLFVCLLWVDTPGNSGGKYYRFQKIASRVKKLFLNMSFDLGEEPPLTLGEELQTARYRLYRIQHLQQNMRWKALAEIYTMHSFAPVSNLKKIRQNLQFSCQNLPDVF